VSKTISISDHLGHRSYRGVTPPVSVIILTLNEEANIAECLKSCAWSDDVHVIDSGSTDRTVEIALKYGATVHHHPFASFGTQRNWAVDNALCKHEWSFHLDADERFTAPLVDEMLHVLGPDGTASEMAAYFVQGRMMFFDQCVRRSAGYPAYQVRLIRRGRCRFIDYGHGQREDTAGPVGKLTQTYMHFPFNRGIAAWFEKHNRYSDLEAERAKHAPAGAMHGLFSQDPLQRRRALKELSTHLPGRSLLRFVYQYVVNGGFTEGRAGLTYCLLMSMYESWIDIKTREPAPALSAAISHAVDAARTQRAGEPKTFPEAAVAFREYRTRMRAISI